MKRTIILSFFLSWLTANVSAQEVWTLQQCIDYALNHNISIKKQKNEIKRLNIERNNLKSDFLPNLQAGTTQKMDFGRSLNKNNTYDETNAQSTSLSLSSEIVLFEGLKRFHSIRKNRYDLSAQIAGTEVTRNDLSLNIVSCYFQILLDIEIAEIARQQVLLTEEQIAKTQFLIDHGKVPHSQLYDVRAQLADDELTVTEAVNTLRLSKLELMQLMELNDTDSFRIVPVRTGNPETVSLLPDEVYHAALTCMPQIKQVHYKVESSMKSIAIARSGYYPSLSLGAGISSGYYHSDQALNASFGRQLQNNMQKSIYITLSIPLFNRFSTRNEIRTAKVQADNALLALEEEKKALYKDIEKAYTDAVSAYEKYESTTRSVEANTEAHRYAQEKYAAGKSTVFEYNESKMKLANALSAQAQAKYTCLLKNRILNFYACRELAGTN